jgi:hypothetical protein
MEVNISKSVGDKIAEIDDDVVALVALDLVELGLLEAPKLGLWRSRANSQNLYEDHWLLAYEAHEHGWLSTGSKNDYVEADPFFSILQSHGVRFYGAELADTESDYGYDGDVDDNTYIESSYGDEDEDEELTPS